MQRAASISISSPAADDRAFEGLRARLEAAAETIIDLLDFMQGDVDLELSGDEFEDDGTAEPGDNFC